jgi:predicted Zn-dependent peptidase
LSRDIPGQLVDLIIDEVLWPNQPLGRDVAGVKETVNAINRQKLLDHWGKYYVPGNTVVTVAGDLEHQVVLDKINQALGSWPGRQRRSFQPADNEQNGPRLRIETRDIEQTHLCLALRGLPANHPDRFALDLLNVVLGEGMTSRLFLEVRERLGLAYDVSSSINHYSDAGSLTIYAATEPSRTEVALRTILHELTQLCQGIPEEEITKAKEFSKGRLLLRMEDTRSIAGWLGGQELLMEQILTVDEVIAKIDAVTPDELKQMAQKLVISDKLSLAVVGPIHKGEERLESLLKL